MKKSVHGLLLLSSALLLAACGGNGENSASSAPTQDSSETSISSEPVKSDSTPIESNPAPAESSSEPEVSIDYTIGWSQDILDVMVPHLGGHAIPFIDLPGRLLATWIEASSSSGYYYDSSVTEEAHLSIISTGGFDNALAGAAKLTYQKAGWNVTFDREKVKMHAEEPDLGIKVDFYGIYDENDKMTNPQVDVYYNEPFVIPADGAWRNATVQVLASIGVESPHMLPYVYLGTLAEEATLITLTNGNAVEIQGVGQGWDTYQNEILAAARSAFPRSKKWTETSETITTGSGWSANSYSATVFTKNFSDGYKVKAALYGRSTSDSYYSSTPKTPFLRVTCVAN
jgi:hypothetical protein